MLFTFLVFQRLPLLSTLPLTISSYNMSQVLCHINDIDDPGARGFEISLQGSTLACFVVKKDSQVFGYVNKCPHVGVNLEWRPHDFLSLDKTLIQCSVHGAEFIIETGYCVAGPCANKSLQALNIHIDAGGYICLSNPPVPPAYP